MAIPKIEGVEVSELRLSPVHNLEPLYDQPQLIEISSIDLDETNPGSVTESLRYKRRAPSIRDSYDILGRIIYPVIVCVSAEHANRYTHVDGFGRIEEAIGRGDKKIRAYVYPSMTLEQRICFRQTLNAAQEPFDTVSIVEDLRILAKERGADLTNPEQVKTLVRDLPEKVQNHKDKIIELARWSPDVLPLIGETYGPNPTKIGTDKIKEMGKILDKMEERHSDTLKKLGGTQALSKTLAKMYLGKKFTEEGKSQQGIRNVAKSLKALPADDKVILSYFSNGAKVTELHKAAKEATPNESGTVLSGCEAFVKVLLNVNTKLLTKEDMAALKRTQAVLNSVLSEAEA